MELKQPREMTGGDRMKGAFLGPAFEQSDIEKRLEGVGAVFQLLTDEEIISQTAQALADGKAIGWFQGRMEFGPRA